MPHRKLNILLICSWYPSREHRTLGNFVQRHALAIGKHHNVTVLYGTESHENLEQLIENDGILEHRVYFKKRAPVLSYKARMRRACRRILSDNSFDLVHLHVTYPAAHIVSSFKLPYVVTEHFSGFHKVSGFEWGSLKKKLVQKVLRNAKAVLPVSNHLGQAIKAFGVENDFIKVSNVVDTNIFKPGDKPASTFTFLHVSSLEERSKNIRGILKAFAELGKLGKEFILKIGGDGDLNELYEKIEDSGLSSTKVETFGESSPEEIAAMMQNSDALVMFSHFENQPCTILEALCCGLPVISSNVGGIPEEIGSDNGILVKKGDDLQFVAALQKMMNEHSKFDKKEISARAASLYSVDSIVNQMDEVYANALNKDS